MAEHGTPARYQTHKKAGEEACDACRIAWNQNQRQIFLDNPAAHESDKMRKRAISRTQTRMRRMFPVEFELIYQEELAKEDGQRASE